MFLVRFGPEVDDSIHVPMAHTLAMSKLTRTLGHLELPSGLFVFDWSRNE